MEKYKKITNMTYFIKHKEICIDDSLNKVVYLKIDRRINNRLRECSYYGRIVHVAKCFFEIIPYCEGFMDKWQTDQIVMKETKSIKGRMSKKNIKELYEVKTVEKSEVIEYEKTPY